MSQGSTVLPTTGTVSGLTMTQDTNAALNALLTANSGSSAPSNTLSGDPEKGQVWLDTSVTPNALRQFDGANWVVLGYMDASSHIWAPPIGGGTDTVASAATADIWAKSPASISITGTTDITALANSSAVPGSMKVVTAAGAFKLKHNAVSLFLPTAADIQTSAGDKFLVLALSATNVAVLAYTRADGTSLAETGVFTGAIFFNGALSPPSLSANTDNWAPSGIATTNTLRVSASAAINITGIVAPAIDGKLLVVDNVDAFPVTLIAESGSSTAANRFKFKHDVTLAPGQSRAIRYDATASRWRMIGIEGGKAPAIQVYSAAGSGTYNTPAGATRLKVRYVGGGAGGGGNGNSSGTGGNTGGNSSFNSIIAVGGSGGGTNGGGTPGAAGTGGSGGPGAASLRIVGGNGGIGKSIGANAAAFGGSGGGTFFGPGPDGYTAGTNATVPGAGGAGCGTTGQSGVTAGGGGGGGEYVELDIYAPGASYSYVVGAGGGAGGSGSGGGNGGSGQDGRLIVEAYFD